MGFDGIGEVDLVDHDVGISVVRIHTYPYILPLNVEEELRSYNCNVYYIHINNQVYSPNIVYCLIVLDDMETNVDRISKQSYNDLIIDDY